MIYQHPLAYLVGLEGVALLRAFVGEYDRDFIDARLEEVRALLDPASGLDHGTELQVLGVVDAYRGWAETYDLPGNALLDLEAPVVRHILDGLPRGVALDAACGTGRHAEYLASLGHRVIGVDVSPDMLARARAKIPDGEFPVADLHRMPLPDDHVDVVVCAFALTCVSDLAPVFVEFVRVLRAGGHLVISDVRGLFADGIRSGSAARRGLRPLPRRTASSPASWPMSSRSRATASERRTPAP